MSYYQNVGKYYDDDATDFESRYWDNSVLQRIRQSFREEVKRSRADSILEVGFGPGFDLVHFARIMPDANVYGVDVSLEMVRLTQRKIDSMQLANAAVCQGSVEDIERCFPDIRYDMIYVFFGALNTVNDLKETADVLVKRLNPEGKMVLTFVNKWFVAGMGIELLKLRFKSAFSRLRPVWGGYSPTKHLASKCYSPREIKEAFSAVDCVFTRGYSIVYPAWYYHGIHRRMPQVLLRSLWSVDAVLSKTVFGTYGEYMLYVFDNTASSIADGDA